MTPKARAKVLVVDDHIEMARMLADALGEMRLSVTVASGGAEAIALLQKRGFDLVITDLRMAEVDGLEVLAAARAVDVELPVLMMTAFGGVESAVEAMRQGAEHYFTKPFRLDEVRLVVERALEKRRLRRDNALLRRGTKDEPSALVGSSLAMRELDLRIDKVAASAAPVLIRGESGTGKELVARELHRRSDRASRPFVAVNCSALSEQLLESELFGHVKGAFTGAAGDRRGLFLEADGGTLFLDELGDMPLPVQAKVLRAIEGGEIRAVGSDVNRVVDVRVVAATHQDLELAVSEGRFRQDLFFRLNVIAVRTPPLRERPEDIPALVEHFLRRSVARNPKSPVREVSAEALELLGKLPYSGNIRELENLVERLVIFGAQPQIEREDVTLFSSAQSGNITASPSRLVTLRELENEYIEHVIRRCGGNKSKAAEILGIDVSTIHRRATRG